MARASSALRGLMVAMCAHVAVGDFCESSTSCVQAGFCNDVSHIETLDAQPHDQLERWELPFVNRTHLIIRWAPSPTLCGETVDSYVVTLNSSHRVFNLVLSVFGSFPQDTCAADSAARAAAKVGDGSRAVSPCGTYGRRCSHRVTETTVELHNYQWQGFSWAPHNLTVQASAYAMLRGRAFSAARKVPLWCISFRKYDPRRGGRVRKDAGGLQQAVGSIGQALGQAVSSVAKAASALCSGALWFNVNPSAERERAAMRAER
eukprot:CAMPEP_0206051126 /NCGR_PEP_ID=MMETSP1466-20131121/30747_1 /ASSEMBLY_ACC=CAM_ASM_001126 /TAXON_ID=44452 /ORGANISM="Pavlova gyrans, Strain CCMP608" /LENGTH=261 /DNA_ID=CAMNT_0053426249 /DNA_START=20 /DNA_END=805 /DNA_ORIENTATION=+